LPLVHETLRLGVLRAITLLLLILGFVWIASTGKKNLYLDFYRSSIDSFIIVQNNGINKLSLVDFNTPDGKQTALKIICDLRVQLKKNDFWLRYLEPLAYKKINGPLPIEWETEVFEKFEKPYKREGSGLSLAEQYIESDSIIKDSLLNLVNSSFQSTGIYLHDSIIVNLNTHDHFFLCNRLFLLNLSSIYNTGFECPDKNRIIPELKELMDGVLKIYMAYNLSYPEFPIDKNYFELFHQMIQFVQKHSENPDEFDHFNLIKNYINPLFAINQNYIVKYSVKTTNYNDFSLNNGVTSIFDKNLYTGQDVKGVYRSISDSSLLNEVHQLGKLFFYDPILSGNNKRSCASCHKPKEYFTDTSVSRSLQFDQVNRLNRNTPTLINVVYNHLIMLDGKHFNLGNQAKDVITNPIEMNSDENELLEKVLSCKDYKSQLNKLAKYSTEKKIGLKHITSALIFYYSSFSNYSSLFDDAMNFKATLDTETILGFNLFMSKAQCATCHFLPHFNGVKPPYIGSEFEVLGVPESNTFSSLSSDQGRYGINPATETLHSFRTGSLRNITHTNPYMHNGVFGNLEEVVEFYDSGGGGGKGLMVSNQTLSTDSLHLSKNEKSMLIKFIHSLDEKIIFEEPPVSLPISSKKKLNNRKIGGEY
jgi:cytochrome c peroxidase